MTTPSVITPDSYFDKYGQYFLVPNRHRLGNKCINSITFSPNELASLHKLHLKMVLFLTFLTEMISH